MQVVAISADAPPDVARAERLVGSNMGFYSDQDLLLTDLFGLRHEGGNPTNGSDIAKSASILLNREGKVLWQSRAQNYRVRIKVEPLLEAVAAAL